MGTSVTSVAAPQGAPRPLVVALAGFGALLAVPALVGKAQDGSHPTDDLLLGGIAGALFLGAGTVAHLRRPQNRVGLLMVLVAVAWFAEDLRFSPYAVVFGLGLLLTHASSAVVVHLILAFPTGRLRSRTRRALVVITYVVVFGLTVPQVIFYDSAAHGVNYPANVFLVADEQEIVWFTATLLKRVGVAIAAGVLVLLVEQWVRASRPMRRVLRPAFATGLVSAATSAFGGLFGYESTYAELGLVVYKAMFCLFPVGFLAGVLRLRVGRSGVDELLVALARPVPPAALRGLLARALDDPSLQVGFRWPESGNLTDADGRALALPPPGAERAVTVLEVDGRRLGVLVHDRALAEDRTSLDAVSTAAALVLERQRLTTETQRQLAEVRESRARIIAAADAARRRMERDLHDGAQQQLVLAALRLREVAARLAARGGGPGDGAGGGGGDGHGDGYGDGYGGEPGGEPGDGYGDPQLVRLLAAGLNGLDAGVAELRELARGLHPTILADGGLGPALESLAARMPVPVDVAVPALPPLPEPVEIAAFYVVAEALTNVAKHARATDVRVRVRYGDGTLRVTVHDDGVGGVAPTAGSGLVGLRDRVRALDGEFVVANPPGGGTVVSASLPCPAVAPQ